MGQNISEFLILILLYYCGLNMIRLFRTNVTTHQVPTKFCTAVRYLRWIYIYDTKSALMVFYCPTWYSNHLLVFDEITCTLSLTMIDNRKLVLCMVVYDAFTRQNSSVLAQWKKLIMILLTSLTTLLTFLFKKQSSAYSPILSVSKRILIRSRFTY